MKSVKDKIVAHRGSQTHVNIQLSPEEVEHLYALIHPKVEKHASRLPEAKT